MRETEMTLGELIDALEKCRPNAEISLKPFSLTPTGIESWRGRYDELALTYRTVDHGERTTVAELLPLLRKMVGSVETGYKGGEYRMDRDTPVWVDNYGEYTETGISHIKVWGSKEGDVSPYQYVDIYCFG